MTTPARRKSSSSMPASSPSVRCMFAGSCPETCYHAYHHARVASCDSPCRRFDSLHKCQLHPEPEAATP